MSLDYVLHRGAGGPEGGGKIFQDVAGLLLDGGAVVGKCRIDLCLDRNAGLVVAGHQSGREDEVSDLHDLRIGDRRMRALEERTLAGFEGRVAMRSTCTRQPGTRLPAMPTVARQGGCFGKYSRHTSSKASKLRRSAWNTWAWTAWSRDVPAPSKVFDNLSRMKRVCRLMAEP